MTGLSIRTSNGSSTTIDESAVKEFARSLKGALVAADSPDYDTARAIWNAMIDRRPALMAACATSDDVVASIRIARNEEG